MTGRRRLFAGLIGTVVLSAAAGWVASAQIRSPAEIAARTAPPVAAPIMVPAEQRVVSTDIVTRGTARFGSPQQLYLALSLLKADAGVANRLPLAGTELREGDVVFTTSGRPVFLLTGEQPAFRDLGPGIEGEDVRQLEAALGRMGFDSGPADGVYDTLTEAAVAAWYKQAGFAAFTATSAQVAAVHALEVERNSSRLDVIAARESVALAEAAFGAAKRARTRALEASALLVPTIKAAVARARADNDAAAVAVAAREAVLKALSAAPTVIPATPAQIAAAQADLAFAKANADVTRLAGVRAVADAVAIQASTRLAGEVAVADAIANGTPADVAAAQAQADAANRAAAADVAAAQAQADAANRSAAAEIAVRQSALDAMRAGTPGTPASGLELAAAEADLATARANVETTRLAGERFVAEAQAADASSRAGVATSLATSRADVRAAQRTVDSANAALTVRRTQTNLVEKGLGLAKLRAGIQVPADEVIFVRSAPVRVGGLGLASGARATGPLMTVTDATVAIDGSLRLEEAPLVAPGMRVLIDEPDLGITATGTIGRVADSPGTNGADGFHVYVEVLVDDAPTSLVGASVRMKIPIESTGGSVLAVPISALTLSADGSSRVQLDRNGKLEFVTVEPGLSADGFVAVTPLEGTLQADDLVVIGFEQQGTATP